MNSYEEIIPSYVLDWISKKLVEFDKRLDEFDAADRQQDRTSFYRPDWYHHPPDPDPPYALLAYANHQPSPPTTFLQPPLTSAATAACLLPQTYQKPPLQPPQTYQKPPLQPPQTYQKLPLQPSQTYQKPPLQPPQTYPSYTGGPTAYSGYVDYKRHIPQPPDPAPPYGAPTYGLSRAQTQMQDPIQPVGQPPYTEQPTNRRCPLPGDNRTAAPLPTAVIQPYRDCPMVSPVVHDEAIVVEEVQVKSCSEVMLLNHKSCDGDEMPMVVPSGVGKSSPLKLKDLAPAAAAKEEENDRIGSSQPAMMILMEENYVQQRFDQLSALFHSSPSSHTLTPQAAHVRDRFPNLNLVDEVCFDPGGNVTLQPKSESN